MKNLLAKEKNMVERAKKLVIWNNYEAQFIILEQKYWKNIFDDVGSKKITPEVVKTRLILYLLSFKGWIVQ